MSFYVTQWSTETGRSPRVDNLRYSKWIQIRQRGFLFQYADITSANFVVIGLVWNKHQAIIWNSVEHFKNILTFSQVYGHPNQWWFSPNKRA